MSESHILLLPKEDFFDWVKATQKYVLAFGVTITPSPLKAGQKEKVTVANYPEGYAEIDIVKWMQDRFPDLFIDVIDINSPEELQAILEERVLTEKRFGEEPPPEEVPDLGIQLHWPTDYAVITQEFGINPIDYAMWGLPGHEGIDFRAPRYSNIYCCAGGKVTSIETRPDAHPYGKHIRIDHPDGFKTVYAHLNDVLIKAGDTVVAKQLIGKSNSTGNSTGSHLHLVLKKVGATERGETNYRGDVIDPTPYLLFPPDVIIDNTL